MKKGNPEVAFILEMAKTQAMLSRRFDSGLGGLSLSEFTILHALSIAPEGRLRRIDLATVIGLTASGVTRLLLPMEKIGLVKSGESKSDARVRHVMIAPGGKRKLEEAMEWIGFLLDELIPEKKQLAAVSKFIADIGDRAQIR